MKKLISLLALSLPLAALPAMAQSVPDAQNRPPATLEGEYPFRPSCNQLIPQLSEKNPNFAAWGPVIGGEHQAWYGIKATTPIKDAIAKLDSMGFCVAGGEVVPWVTADGASVADANLSPREQNLKELRAKAKGDASATDGEQGDSSAFFVTVALLIGGVLLWEKFEDKPWFKRVTGDSPNKGPKVFDNLPPSFEETEIPDRISPEDLRDLPNSPDEPRSALETFINTPFVSRAIFGFQRTGKTNMVAIALSKLAAKYGVHAFVINLNAYTGNGEQDVYWQGEHITAVLGDLGEISDEDEAQALIDKASKLVDEFTKHHGPAILVVDEWSGTTASHATHVEQLQPLIKKIAGRVTSLASTGVQREKAIWTIAPEMVAETMDAFGKAVKKLSVCLVAIAPGHTAKWKTTELSFSDELLTQVRKNFPGISDPPKDSEHSRIAYIDGQWRALGTEALVKVGAVSIGESDKLAAARSAIASLPTTEDNLPEDLKLFREWLDSKVGEVISYDGFKNANKLRSLSRARESFDSLCDKACMKGWLKQVDGVSETIYQVIK